MVASVAALLAGCSSPEGRQGTATPAGAQPAATEMPAIPDSLTEPEARADYLGAHFWDAIELAAQPAPIDSAAVEQHWANFLSFLPYATSEGAEGAFAALIDRCGADSRYQGYFAELAEKYLDERGSPMRSEELFEAFLSAQLASAELDAAAKLRPRHQLDELRLNRPGSVAADFRFVDRRGAERSLHEVAAEARRVMLVIYDPDCESCHQVMEQIAVSPPGECRVVAVDAEADRDRWEATKEELPEGWIVGYALDDLQGRGLYSLRVIPAIFILDEQGRVIDRP